MTVCMFPESNNHMNCSKCPHQTCTLRNITVDPQHGREPEPKPLAQYLDEYLRHEIVDVDRELLQQALDAYESTEQVKIRIEQV